MPLFGGEININDSSDKTITGRLEWDRVNGGILIPPSGTSFPGTPEEGELFWRTDEQKLYRRGASTWDAVTAVPASHASTHQHGGSDEVATATAAANAIPKANGAAKIDIGWVPTGATGTTVCIGNDARLSDARTPTAHKVSHEPGGTDALTVDAAAVTGSLRTIGTGALQACAGNDSRLSDARTPTSHASSHNAGGGDALAIDAAAGTGSLRTLGTSATSACAGNDSRLSDARTPTVHAASHHTGGTDLLAHQSIPGSGTNTHAQIDTHVGSTSNPHSVTKTQVGLGNVTDDAQLKRAAADFAGFTAKATPVSADVLLIEDSADSNNKKKVTVGSLPSSVFGADYQTAISTARSTTTSATMQDKTTLTTGALTGTYRVGWCSVIDSAAANKLVEAQLYNVTDAAVVGAVQIQRPSLATPRMVAGGFAEVVFAGAAKTFKIQYRSTDGSTTVGIQDARIELWRVS